MPDRFHDDCSCGEPGSHALAQLWREQRGGAVTPDRTREIIEVARADDVPWNLIAEALRLPVGQVLEQYS